MSGIASRKLQYLEESYDVLTSLGGRPGQEVFLVRKKDGGKIYIKKYVSSKAAEVYDRLKDIVHKNIPRIYSVAQSDGQGIIIEEFINGETLEEYVEKRGILEEDQVCSIVKDICSALFVVHNRGIVHRDIKPENVMISNDGVVKVIDFGIARKIKEGKTQDTEILGTAGYAAPEQYGYSQTDARADIYAVGVLMNRLLTGELPAQHLYSVPAVQNIIRRCIEMDAKNRFQTIQELRSTLESIPAVRHQETTGIIPERKTDEMRHNINRNRRPGHIIKGVPGFRTGVLWKNVVATLGYLFLMLSTYILMEDYTSSVTVFLLEACAVFLYVWAATLVGFNAGYWDRKFILTRRFPKEVTLILRIVLWALIFNLGIQIEDYVKYDILGMIRK